MKKVFLFALVLLHLAALLSGCGAKQEEASELKPAGPVNNDAPGADQAGAIEPITDAPPPDKAMATPPRPVPPLPPGVEPR
jgi:hypothetical protein